METVDAQENEVPRRRGGIYRQHNFRMLWTGRTSSWIGTSMSVVSMPLLAVGVLHTSTFVVGLLQAAASVPWLLFGFPAGAWADRLRKRPVLLVSNVVAFIAFLSVPLAYWGGFLTVPQLVGAEFVGGVAAVFFSCAYNPFMPLVFPDKKERLDANGKLQSSASVAKVVGPSAGGAVAEFFGPVFGVVANAVSFGVSALSLLAMRVHEPAMDPAKKHKSLGADIGEGLKYTFSDPYLRMFVSFCALANLGDAMMEAVWVVFLVRTAGLPAGVAGVMVALMGLGGAVGALLPTWISAKAGSARGMLLALAIGSPFTLLMPLTQHGPRAVLFVIGGFVYLMGVMASNVIFFTFAQDYIPKNLLGRVSSVITLLGYIATPLGALAGAGLAAAFGPRNTLWASAIVITLSVGVLWGPLKGKRDFPEPEPELEPGSGTEPAAVAVS